jgi:WD40 repeat protein
MEISVCKTSACSEIMKLPSTFVLAVSFVGLVMMEIVNFTQQTMLFMFQMLVLGLQGDRLHAPVTSMCFNQQGDLLLAGYSDGHITVWDIQRSSAAKVITGEHTSPIVHTLFLGQDSQVTRQFKAVTGDSKGLVLLHAFSVVPLLNRFSIKTQVKH